MLKSVVPTPIFTYLVMTVFLDCPAGLLRGPGLYPPAARGWRSGRSLRVVATGWLVILLLDLAVWPLAQAGQSVVASWAPSPDSAVTGYKIYYGGSSGNYTNFIVAGNVTNSTISGLAGGTTYYFACTAVNGNGGESGFSTEVSYTVPPAPITLATTMAVGGRFQLAGTGLVGHTYEIQATTNLVAWEAIGTGTPDTNGYFRFTDENAQNYPMRFYRVWDAQP
jgi:hypothetical protein